VFGGKRIGATVSVPTESDCRFLEKPPVVPPLVFRATGWAPERAADAARRERARRARGAPLDVSLGGISATGER
jgi:hypothetical protein